MGRKTRVESRIKRLSPILWMIILQGHKWAQEETPRIMNVQRLGAPCSMHTPLHIFDLILPQFLFFGVHLVPGLRRVLLHTVHYC